MTVARRPHTDAREGEGMQEWLWVFHGEGGSFCSAVFDERLRAETWIKENKASGMLSKMPLNTSVYDWVIANGHFTPMKEYQTKSAFIQNFTSACLEHHHYADGDLKA